MPLDGIGKSEDMGAMYLHFCARFAKLTGIDLIDYKPRQIQRRLGSYCERYGFADLYALLASVAKDPDNRDALLNYLAINVSEFFRNKEQWLVLQEDILPEILTWTARGEVRVWSAGTASGQEAYSLAMAVLDVGGTPEILGTDIDEQRLAKARYGFYPLHETIGLDAGRLLRYFKSVPQGHRASQALRAMVRFERHNLLGDEYPKDTFHLIACRNVLIYFSERGKQRIMGSLASALRTGGVLFTGSTEVFFRPSSWGLAQIRPFFYQRV